MTILIDAPNWPAHGTLWAHLVSDSDLAELHDFAARCAVPERSFDLDHYDVPAERHAQLVAAGARYVDGRELIRRLLASGIRVRSVDRRTRAALAQRWERLLPGHPRIGEELAVRWSEPHRRYHGLGHLVAVLDRLDRLADGGERVTRPVRLAAWCHDAVHEGASPADELASAELAETLLTAAVGPAEAAEVARLVRVTASHDPDPGDAAGQVLCDADLGVLGGDREAYRVYAEQVRAEYAQVPAADFRRGRATILRALLERPRLFRTPTGVGLWEANARRHITAELAELEPA